jgi:hypothetical protein
MQRCSDQPEVFVVRSVIWGAVAHLAFEVYLWLLGDWLAGWVAGLGQDICSSAAAGLAFISSTYIVPTACSNSTPAVGARYRIGHHNGTGTVCPSAVGRHLSCCLCRSVAMLQ